MPYQIFNSDSDASLQLAPSFEWPYSRVIIRDPPHSLSATRRIRVLHTVGHLGRSGIENWLYQTILRTDTTRFENVVLVLTKEEEAFTAEFRAAGIKIVDAPSLRQPHLFCLSFLRLLREEGPFDVLHTHGFSMLTTASLALARLTGVKHRILHGHNDLRPRLKHLRFLYRTYVSVSLQLSRRLATRRLACSNMASEWTFGERQDTPAKQRAELLIGTDLNACLMNWDSGLKVRLGIPEGRFVLAQIGRFTVAKNHAFTLEVARLLAESHIAFHLLFMGDGPLQERIREQVDRLGLAGNVTWLPNCREVPAVLRSAVDAVLLPSLHEGLGLAVVEAQAAGVPVLVSDSVTRECVILLQLAHFLPIDRGPDLWVEQIRALIEEPRSRTPDSEHRQAVLTSRFHIDHSVARLSELYLELNERVPGGPQ